MIKLLLACGWCGWSATVAAIAVPITICVFIDPEVDATFVFKDGSSVKMKVKNQSILVQTKYGQLKVPIEDIRKMELEKGKIIIHTEDGLIIGKSLQKDCIAWSPYFEERTIKFSDLKSLTTRLKSTAEKVILPDADWIDMGLSVIADEELTVKVVGSVDLWPQTPGQYVTTAKGHTTQGKDSPHPAGALLLKIGNKIFLPGENWTGSINSSGKIELMIVPSPWNNLSNGSYRVTIRRE